MSQIMGRTVCTADPPLCLADSMAPSTSLATAAVSLAHVTSAPPERRRRSPHQDAISAHRAFVRQTLALPHVRWVRTTNDLITLPAGELGVLFGTQYAPRGMTETAIGEWRSARLQSMAPFFATSEYGGGSEKDDGLTERGRMLIEWMSMHGLILDFSNAGHHTAREALAFIRQENLSAPLMASHAGCHSIFPHPRNLPDDVLRGIADMGGYVGISVRASLLAEESDYFQSALVRHLSHASSVCGFDNVGIGSSVMVDFVALERKLRLTLGESAVEGYVGRNFEFFLIRTLP